MAIAGGIDQQAFDPPAQMIFFAHRNVAAWPGELQAAKLADENGIRQIVLFVLDSKGMSVTEVRRMSMARPKESKL